MPMPMFSPSSGKTLRAGSSSGSVISSVGASVVTSSVISSVSFSVGTSGAGVTASVVSGFVVSGTSEGVQAASSIAVSKQSASDTSKVVRVRENFIVGLLYWDIYIIPHFRPNCNTEFVYFSKKPPTVVRWGDVCQSSRRISRMAFISASVTPTVSR